MALTSPRRTFRQQTPVPLDWSDTRQWLKIIARALLEAQLKLQKVTQEVVSVTADYTMVDIESTICADATTASMTVTLLSAKGRKGQRIGVKKTDATANTVTIDPDGTETIDGETTIVLTSRYAYREMESDGTNWVLVSAIGYAAL